MKSTHDERSGKRKEEKRRLNGREGSRGAGPGLVGGIVFSFASAANLRTHAIRAEPNVPRKNALPSQGIRPPWRHALLSSTSTMMTTLHVRGETAFPSRGIGAMGTFIGLFSRVNATVLSEFRLLFAPCGFVCAS